MINNIRDYSSQSSTDHTQHYWTDRPVSPYGNDKNVYVYMCSDNDFSLTLVVNGGFGCLKDSGSGRAHVQFCQGELIHEVRQLKKTKANTRTEPAVHEDFIWRLACHQIGEKNKL